MTDEQGELTSYILYHYCDVHAFESIIRRNEIWLCPFAYSNDSGEGQACLHALKKLASESGTSPAAMDQFLSYMSNLSEVIGCYGMSLSEQGDLLSQWRGYAADGAGFAIGFDRRLLQTLPALPVPRQDVSVALPLPSETQLKLHKVEYDEKASIDSLRPLFESLRPSIQIRYANADDTSEENAFADVDKVMAHFSITQTLLNTWGALYGIKGAAFEEEREHRISTAVTGGSSAFQYRVSRGMLVPYLPYVLPDPASRKNPIREVVVGPRNPTPECVIQMLLRQYRHDVIIRRSAATYR